MILALMTIALAVIWALITGSFTAPNLGFGILVSAAALYILRDNVGRPNGVRRLWKIGALGGLFIRELLMSAIRVAGAVLLRDPARSLRPAIIAYPLSVRSDAEIAVLANLITLTPGTLSVDVSDDRSVLFIHALDLADRDALIAEIAGGFEAQVREVFA